MSYQIRSWDELSDACKDFLKENSISELLEIVGDAIESTIAVKECDTDD